MERERRKEEGWEVRKKTGVDGWREGVREVRREGGRERGR